MVHHLHTLGEFDKNIFQTSRQHLAIHEFQKVPTHAHAELNEEPKTSTYI